MEGIIALLAIDFMPYLLGLLYHAEYKLHTIGIHNIVKLYLEAQSMSCGRSDGTCIW